MALNLKKSFQGLKVGALAGLATLTPGFAMADDKDTVPAKAPATETAALTTRNVFEHVPKTAHIIYGKKINDIELQVLQEVLKEDKGIEVHLHPYDPNIDRIDLQPTEMLAFSNGFKVGVFDRSAFAGQLPALLTLINERFQQKYDERVREKTLAENEGLALSQN